jgi:predicted dehydrogenase
VLDRYQAVAALSDAEMELARRGMYEDFAFLRAVEAGKPSFPDFRTARAAHVVVDACYRSAGGGAELSVPKV